MIVLFFTFCLLFVVCGFIFGFNSKKRVWSKWTRKWTIRTRKPGKIVVVPALIAEGISIVLMDVFTGTFIRVLDLSIDFAEADINPFWVLLSAMIATAVFSGVVVHVSRLAYKFGQNTKERFLSSGR